MDSNCSNRNKTDLLFFAAVIAVALLQLYKSFQGIGPIDEHCYIALGYRLVKGDALIFDEWHITQLIAVFIAPLIRLYLSVNGSMNGIVHFFRLCYIVFQTICGSALYLRFRRHGLMSMLGALCYLLFTPFHIMTLSYNTMSIGFLLLAAVCFDPESNRKNVLCGIFFACAVLNTPYLALLYGVFTVCSLRKKPPFAISSWRMVSAGAILTAIVFFAFLFSRETVSQLMIGLSHLRDKGHVDSVFILLAKGAGKLFQAFGIFLVCFLMEIFGAVLARKKQNHTLSVMQVSAALNALSAVYVMVIHPYMPELGGHALILLPFAWTGLIALLLFPMHDMQYEKIFYFLSVFHALMVAVSSNVGPRSFCSMLITACAMTLLFLENAMPASFRNQLFAGAFCLMLGISRLTGVYDAEGKLNTRVSEGPLAGLYDTAEQAETAAELLVDVQEINRLPEHAVLFVSYHSWLYLATEKTAAASSAYINPGFEAEWVENQKAYALLHPSRREALCYLDESDPPYGWNGSEPFFAELTLLKPMRMGKLYRMGEVNGGNE